MIWWVLLLYFGGLILIVAEFLVPGGVCGAAGGMAVIASAVLGSIYYPDFRALILIGEFVGVIVGILFGLWLFPRSPLGKAMVLSDGQQADQGWVASASDNTLLHQTGEVFSPLRPSGSIVVDGRRIQAVSSGDLIERGEKVRVIEVRGSRVVVEPIEPRDRKADL